MSARSVDRETFYRVDTDPPRPGQGIFTKWRLPGGQLVVSMRRDVYEAGLEAAAEAMRRIKKEKGPYKP